MEKKGLFIIKLNNADYLMLVTLAIGVCSTYNSNREHLIEALIFLLLAAVSYLVASSFAVKYHVSSTFTRSFGSFVSGLLFLVAPAIFCYHWQFNGPIESAALLIFIISGILRISAFNDFGSRMEHEKFFYRGIPVFWSPVILLVFYPLSFYIEQGILNAILTAVFIFFSVLMLVNRDFRVLYGKRK